MTTEHLKLPDEPLTEAQALNEILAELKMLHATLDRVGQVTHDMHRTLMLLGAQAGLIDVEQTPDGRVNISPKGRGNAPRLFVPQ
jgi:hypothetical protein